MDKLKEWYRRHPHVGYGMTFAKWAAHPTDRDPYNSWGNGSAGAIAEGFYFGVPVDLRDQALQRLDEGLLTVLAHFWLAYPRSDPFRANANSGAQVSDVN